MSELLLNLVNQIVVLLTKLLAIIEGLTPNFGFNG